MMNGLAVFGGALWATESKKNGSEMRCKQDSRTSRFETLGGLFIGGIDGGPIDLGGREDSLPASSFRFSCQTT